MALQTAFHDISPFYWNKPSKFGHKHAYGINPKDRRAIDRIKLDFDDGLKEIDRALHSAASGAIDPGEDLRNEASALSQKASPAGADDHASSIAPEAAEIARIEDRMRRDRTGYFKDETMQKRYRTLLDKRRQRTATEPASIRPPSQNVQFSR